MIQDWVVLAPGGILCLTPITMYCFWLASVNRGERPVVVSGVWDFVGLLASLSGVILCVGVLLTALSANLPLTSQKGFGYLRDAWATGQVMLAVTPIAYLLIIVSCAYLVLKTRRNSLHVYNIDELKAEQAIARVLEKRNISATRRGNLWSSDQPLLETSTFHVFSHVTVKLLAADPRLNEELERELRQTLCHVPVGENPGGPWLMTATVSTFISTISCLILTFVLTWKR